MSKRLDKKIWGFLDSTIKISFEVLKLNFHSAPYVWLLKSDFNFKWTVYIEKYWSILGWCNYLNVVSSLWLLYPLEDRTCRLPRAPALPFRDGNALRTTPPIEFSDEDDDSSRSTLGSGTIFTRFYRRG